MSVIYSVGDVYETIAQCKEQSRFYDVTITDPPYTEHVQARLLAGKKASGVRGAYTKEIECEFEALSEYGWVKDLVAITNRWTLAFCALEQLGLYKDACPSAWVRSGIYCKLRAMPQMTGDRPGNRCEGVSIFHKSGRKRWNGGGGHAFWLAMPENRKATRHPTAKPLFLCMRLVELFSEPGEVVFDPFCGTGSIGIACGLLGRHYYGVDINRKFIDNARFRFMAAMLKAPELMRRYSEYCATKGAA